MAQNVITDYGSDKPRNDIAGFKKYFLIGGDSFDAKLMALTSL
jgi:hypothetical protein